MDIKKIALRVTSIIVAAVIAAAMLGCSGSAGILGGNSEYTRPQMSIYTAELSDGDRSAVVINGELLNDTIPGYVRDMAASQDFSKVIVSSNSNDDSGLYIASADGLLEINDSAPVCVAISPDGTKAAYASDDGIIIFDTSGKGDPVKIDDEDEFYDGHFSPDSNTFVYNVISVSEAEINKCELKVYMNDELQVLDDDARVLSTSNGGEFIYFVRLSDNSLNVINAQSKEVTKIAEHASPDASYGSMNSYAGGDAIFNSAGTEMVFVTTDGTFYVEKAGEAKKLFDDSDIPGFLLLKPWYSVLTDDPQPTSFTGVSSLKNKAYLTGNGIYYLDSNAEPVQITETSSDAKISPDGKTLYYFDDGGLYRCNLNAIDEAEKLTDTGDEYFDLAVSEDQQHIYLFGGDGTLQHLSSGGELTEIADSLPSYTRDNSVMLSDGRLYYLGEDESTLYYTQNGEDPVEVGRGIDNMYMLSVSDSTGIRLMTEFSFTYTKNGSRSDPDSEYYVIDVNSEKPVQLRGGATESGGSSSGSSSSDKR